MREALRIKVDGIDLDFSIVTKRDGETIEEIKAAPRRSSFHLIGDSSMNTNLIVGDPESMQRLCSGRSGKRYEIIINEIESDGVEEDE